MVPGSLQIPGGMVLNPAGTLSFRQLQCLCGKMEAQSPGISCLLCHLDQVMLAGPLNG